MEYQVPQFIEVESKIVGPLTLKQFIYIAGGAGLCILFFVYLPIIFAFLLSAPIAALAVALSFYKVNGKPFADVLEAGFNYYTNAKFFLWKHQTKPNSKTVESPAAPQREPSSKLTRGKLSELAWSLDVPLERPLLNKKNNMATSSAGATQQFVPVKEIKNGIVVLKDGSYRGILICSAVNFGLKSADEQHAIVLGFQDFLNTLDFSIQIVINSRKMDLRPYLSLLEEKEPEQKTELLLIQLREYIAFIKSFAEQANIMTKSFYIVVPYSPHASAASAMNFLKRGNVSTKNTADETSFGESRAQLEQRLSLIIERLYGTGVRAVPLGTEEVIELLYRSFNPGELENPIRLDN